MGCGVVLVMDVDERSLEWYVGGVKWGTLSAKAQRLLQQPSTMDISFDNDDAVTGRL